MSSITTEITAWYQAVQFRAPPASELATYVALVNAGTLTPVDVQSDIINSPYTAEFVNPVIREYQAAFGRVPDQAGQSFWVNTFATASSPLTALGQISTIFANSAEFSADYGGATATTPANTALVSAFYHNVLQRAPDAAGLAFWTSQGLDAAQLLQAFATSAEFATETASPIIVYQQLEITQMEPTTGSLFQLAPSATEFTLTPNADTFATGATGAIFNAFPFVQLGGLNNNTLNIGDSLTDTAGDGTLNFTAVNNGVAANPPLVTGVTLTGIKTLNYSSGAAQSGSITGAITGLQVVNETAATTTPGAHAVALALGAQGQGLLSPLTNVNVTSYQGGNGTTIFAGTIAATAVPATPATINVAITGAVGGTGVIAGVGQADTLLFQTDQAAAGTATSPNMSYGAWNLTVNSVANLQLDQGGVGGATALVLAGAGNMALGQDFAGNWQKLTSIDASATTGSVYITGNSTTFGSNAVHSVANPHGLFGSAAGLLDDGAASATFALTTFKLGTGVDTLDASSATAAEVAALTTTPAATVAAGNEIIVSSLVADTTATTTFANIKGFSVLGVVSAGSLAGGDTGTIDMANLPASVNDIFYQTAAVGALTIKDQIAALTVDTEDNGVGNAITSTANAGSLTDSFTLLVGNTVDGNVGAVGAVTLTSDTFFTITAQGTTGVTDSVGAVTLTPAITGNEQVTLGGAEPLAVASIMDVTSSAAPIVNNMTITVSDTDAVALGGENAILITAGASGGLTMTVGDSNFTNDTTAAGVVSLGPIGTSAGDTITGSTADGNVLIGSIGNDKVTGNTSLINGDTIATDGGADTIVLQSGHTTASDHIELFPSAHVTGAQGPGTALTHGAGLITSGTDVSQVGWWGNATAATGLNTPAHYFANIGTSADMSTVAGFNTATDVIDFSVGAWGVGAVSDGLTNTSLAHETAAAAPVFSALTNAGTTIGLVGGVAPDILVIGGQTFASATTVAGVLSSGTGGLTFSGGAGLAAGAAAHIVIAYADAASDTRIADLDIFNSTAAAVHATNTAGVVVSVSDMVQITGVSLNTFLSGVTATHEPINLVA